MRWRKKRETNDTKRDGGRNQMNMFLNASQVLHRHHSTLFVNGEGKSARERTPKSSGASSVYLAPCSEARPPAHEKKRTHTLANRADRLWSGGTGKDDGRGHDTNMERVCCRKPCTQNHANNR